MEESGTDAGVDLETVGERMAIRSAVESGSVSAAFERVNQLDPAVLESNPELRFRMLQLGRSPLVGSWSWRGEVAVRQW